MIIDQARKEREREYDRIREEYAETKMKRKEMDASQLDFQQEATLPRHEVVCKDFEECPFDMKCRAYDPKYLKCVNCPLARKGKVCRKPLHNPGNFERLIDRPRIDLDEQE
ncbi:hypothetical protein ACQR3P_29360 [Rhodococcus sp. IEGM1300]